jgi:hypothetical protein
VDGREGGGAGDPQYRGVDLLVELEVFEAVARRITIQPS